MFMNYFVNYFVKLCAFKRFGVEPPGLIKLEKEIEQEETLSTPLPSPSPSPSKSPGKKSTGKLLDDAVRQTSRIFWQETLYVSVTSLVLLLWCGAFGARSTDQGDR